MEQKIRVWDLPVRLFHWLLAGSFVVAYTIAESDPLRKVHVILGYTAVGLILFRIIWGFVGSRYGRFASFAFAPGTAINYLRTLRNPHEHYVGHTPAGSYAIYAILIVGLLTGVTGYMTLSHQGGESLEEAHELFANVWLALVIFHVAGVIIASYLHRENLVRSMITGYKRNVPGHSTDTSTESTPATMIGIALGGSVAAFWIWSLLTGSVPGAGEDSVGKRLGSREMTSEQVTAGQRPQPEGLASEKRTVDRETE